MEMISVLMENDKLFQNLLEENNKLEKEFLEMDMSDEQKDFITEYIESIFALYHRKNRLTYIAGMLDEANKRFL